MTRMTENSRAISRVCVWELIDCCYTEEAWIQVVPLVSVGCEFASIGMACSIAMASFTFVRDACIRSIQTCEVDRVVRQ